MAKVRAAGRHVPGGVRLRETSLASPLLRAFDMPRAPLRVCAYELSDLVDLVEALLCDAPFCGRQRVWEVRAELSPVSPGGPTIQK